MADACQHTRTHRCGHVEVAVLCCCFEDAVLAMLLGSEIPPPKAERMVLRVCTLNVLLQVLAVHLLDTFNPAVLTALPPSAQQASASARQQAFGLAAGLARLQAATTAASGRGLPVSGSKQEWLAFIARLPEDDAPRVFGLPANIGRALSLGTSRALLGSLRQLGAVQVRAGWQRGCGMVCERGDGQRPCMLSCAVRLPPCTLCRWLRRLLCSIASCGPPSCCRSSGCGSSYCRQHPPACASCWRHPAAAPLEAPQRQLLQTPQRQTQWQHSWRWSVPLGLRCCAWWPPQWAAFRRQWPARACSFRQPCRCVCYSAG